jgi:RNA polymerase sigma-70 factor (ECF subfamily)
VIQAGANLGSSGTVVWFVKTLALPRRTFECGEDLVTTEGFDAFFVGIWSDLSAYAWSLTGDEGVGHELAQEALTRVYVRFRLLNSPRPYAFRVVTNLARDRWKALDRERRSWEALPTSLPADDGAVLDAVQRLRAPHREVLVLHYWADLPVIEVAAIVRRPVGTVKRRLSEARQALRVALEE